MFDDFDWPSVAMVILIIVGILAVGFGIFLIIDQCTSSQVCTFTAKVINKDEDWVYNAASEMWDEEYEVTFDHSEFGVQNVDVSRRDYKRTAVGGIARFEQRQGGITKSTYFKMLK